MITITNGEDEIAHVTLENGKLNVKYTGTNEGVARDVIDSMQSVNGHKLTDAEAYRMMPFRLTGRVSASVSGHDATMLRDPSVYEAKMAEIAKRR